MSRAFTKEEANEQPVPLPERPVSAAPNLVTPRGASLIEATVARLERQLAKGEDEAAARDLRYWKTRLSTLQVVADTPSPQKVAFGTHVTIERHGAISRIQIVGEDEADPAQGRIGWTAPLARAIDGAQAGETVDLEIGGREETVKIIEVRGGPAEH
jgi:transcription elongation GreA/GreB family factor